MDEEAEAAEGYEAEDLRKTGAKWLERIKQAEAREEGWRREAEKATKAYLHDAESEGEGKVYEMNILHSNVETIAPAIYNSTPVPDIRERFRVGRATEESAIAQEAAQVIERAIMVQIDDGRLDQEVEAAVQDALVTGRGVLRLRFDADEVEQIDPMTGMPQVAMQNERLGFEVVSWRDYREGPARRWEDVPWVAFRHCLPWEEVQRIQDPAIKEALSTGGVEEKPTASADADTFIWEIWCKETGRVYMVVDASGEMLSIADDPLGLPGFFPMPAPLQPITPAGRRTPVCPFTVYRVLAEELENITKRIRAIVSGLKVRGLIVGDASDIAALADAPDNTLIPIANLEGLAQTGGLDKAITWWPVDQAITVLRELYVMREQTKSAIYEITGISDIVRGQGQASETATAQEIKTQWGSLRIRKLQRQVERCVRDVFVIAAELICSKFSPQTLQSMTGIAMLPPVAQILSQPLDHYRIDVESDSTVRADMTRRKGEMAEFLNGTAQFFSAMAPVVQSAPAMAGPVAEMYAAFARQFSLGKQAEDAIESMAELAKQSAEQAQQAQAQAAQMQQQAMERDMALKEGKLRIEEGKAEIDALTKVAAFG
jgi:hypothetical protein